MTAHLMTPSLGPLRHLAEQFLRFLGRAEGRADAPGRDDFDFAAADRGHTAGDRARALAFLRFAASTSGGWDEPALIANGNGFPLSEFDLEDGDQVGELIDEVLDALGDELRARPKARAGPAPPSDLPRRIQPDPDPRPQQRSIAVNTNATDLAAEVRAQNDRYYRSMNRLAPDPGATLTAAPGAEVAPRGGGGTLADEVRAQNDRHYANRRPAAPAAPAAAAPDGPMSHGVGMAAPVAPTPEQEGAFLARLAQARGSNGAAAAALRSAAEALSARAVSLAGTFPTAWLAQVLPIGVRRARLAAMAAALEGAEGEAIRYAPPSPEDVAAETRRLVATVARTRGIGPAKLLADVRAASATRAAAAARAEGELHHRTMAPLAESDASRDALADVQILLPDALGRAVAQAVADAGGRASVASDLAAVHLIDATEPDPDEGELAEVKAQLKALGSDAAGRAAQGLQTRHDELSATLERRRSEARAEASGRAERDLSSSLAGDAEAFDALAALVKSRPAAFAPGLAAALAGVPARALAEVGSAPML